MNARRPRIFAELRDLALALVIASVAVTGLAGVAELAGAAEPSRVGRKALVPAFLAAWVVLLGLKRGDAVRAFGLEGARTRLAVVARGLLCGAGSLALLNLILMAVDARRFEPELAAGALALKVVLYLLQALGLALLEESLFRGVLHGRLRAAAGARVAIIVGSVVFGVSHFLRPPKTDPPQAWWDTMRACGAGLGEAFTTRWKECVGLILVGLVLALLREGRRTILLPLGVHAGWVWVRFVSGKTLVEVKDTVREDLFLFGTMRLYDGVLGWAALLLTLVIARRAAARGARRDSEAT